ncbi:hypothetical protein THAOC_05572 [Thalassiosira oceanica]|uniref:Uncharacterized protein n=1 Tax=Thalassiosira oceanica TaxID=159749 RepID=K0T5C4_THAOC|nr:hypothetical protein THAOC_05572 [Thalassiosira oceanica]|eukprot:EJK72855.1 hypothetical protein THAOC_05572 [Thalassiosira oceanica]
MHGRGDGRDMQEVSRLGAQISKQPKSYKRTKPAARLERQLAQKEALLREKDEKIAGLLQQMERLGDHGESFRQRQTARSDSHHRLSSPNQITEHVFRQPIRNESRGFLSPNQITDESNSEPSIFTLSSSLSHISHLESHLGSQESSPSDDGASPRDGAWVIPFDADACVESGVGSAVGDQQRRNNALREICTTSSFRPVVPGANRGSSVVRPTPVRGSLSAKSPPLERARETGKGEC